MCSALAGFLERRMTDVKTDARKFFVHCVLRRFITGDDCKTIAGCTPDEKKVLEACSIGSLWNASAHGQTLRACLAKEVRADCAVVVGAETKVGVQLFAKWRDAAMRVGLVAIPEGTLHWGHFFQP